MKKSTLCFGLAIGNHLSSVDAGKEGFGFPRSADLSNRKIPSLSKSPATATQASASHTTTFVDETPSSFADAASDIDADFDPNFIHNILRDQGVIPASTSVATGSSNVVDEPELPTGPPGSAYQEMDDESIYTDDNQPHETHGGQRLPHSPVIYRYYGKSRSRTRISGSIPFILLGPDIDHWRTTGEHLAARGFSVIACERDPFEPEEEGRDITLQSGPSPWHAREEWWKGMDAEGAYLILNVLQASRWSKAILVACDSEAVIAIQAVMVLAPEKIAGVVLCGDLQEVDALLLQSHPDLSRQEGDFAIDAFLRAMLPCPFAIAWDGETVTDMPALATPSEFDGSSPAECLTGHRCLILGGGIAPHRRQPETFSWALTRFVEDKVAPSVPIAEQKKIFQRVRKFNKEKGSSARIPAALSEMKSAFSGSFISGDYFSTGSFVVYGRILASALLYASMLKVGIFQYSNFLDGMVNMKSRYDGVQRIKRKALGGAASFFINFGYIPLLFKRSEGGDESLSESTEEKVSHDLSLENCEEGEGATQSEADEALEESVEEKEEDEDNADDSLNEKEKERELFQPLFFLDRVVA